MQSIGSQRECFFDDHLIDSTGTTAEFRLHKPVPKGPVIVHDTPWEGNATDYYNFFFDKTWHGTDGTHEGGMYRMYYIGFAPHLKNGRVQQSRICYAESEDGIHWIRPSLGLRKWEGSTDNNMILFVPEDPNFDNFTVFRDENPACLPEEQYKAVTLAVIDDKSCLRSYMSPDGIHFHPDRVLTYEGRFDTLNCVFWDPTVKKYRIYIRNVHPHADGAAASVPLSPDFLVRDIRYLESEDFVTFTHPVPITHDDDRDIPLYTPCVFPYFRAPQMLIAFPTRYIERSAWTDCYEQLPGQEDRKERIADLPRRGLALTDTAFMVSENGIDFHLYREAFMHCEEENGRNWVYGDCYPALGLIATPSDIPGAPDEISMYMPKYPSFAGKKELHRYTIRMDGFASLHAGGREETVTTKVFTYEGSALHVNYETSALGHLYFSLISGDGTRYDSCEYFGNTIDRVITFPDDAVKALSGKPVRLVIRMLDAELYSLCFS